MATPTREQIIEQLRTVNDPELHKDLVSLNMVRQVEVSGSTATVHIDLTTPACPLKDQIRNDVVRAVGAVAGIKEVNVEFGAQAQGQQPQPAGLPGVKNVVAVGAGKGGVGKSTASVLLAVGLARKGAKVGLLDADVYGPSIPTLMGLRGARPSVAGEVIRPIESAGVKMISIGFLVEPEQALIWRGPMVHGVVTQFLRQVDWGELDHLIVDLPPGTGDVPLSLAQAIPVTGSVIICTPQDIALSDARRAVMMYHQLNVPCLGIIENMSYYLCPKCGHRDEVFDHGGAEAAARELGVPFLGAIPLNARIRGYGDAGTPDKYFSETTDHVKDAVEHVVRETAASVERMASRQQPTLTIE